MNNILCQQLSLDYCCSPQEVQDTQNHYNIHRFLDGRRRFLENQECALKIAAVNGKLLFAGRADLLSWCREHLHCSGGEWFFEAKNLRILNDRLHQDGLQIEAVHPFFIGESISKVDTGTFEIQWYEGNEIEQFRGDGRYDEAFAFCPDAPDILGVSALQNGEIIGMAGASFDSPTMWQIGINVDPNARQRGIGKMLVSLLKNALLQRGILPFYGTAISHIASQRTAVASGFVPAWAELATSRID